MDVFIRRRVAGRPGARSSCHNFRPRTETFDYVKREEMIPMHDGVKLKTFILIPKGASHAPILLTPDAIQRVRAGACG